MISDAKSVAPDVGETVAAIEGLRAIILGEDGEVEDRGPLARPCDTQVHPCGGDARSLAGFGDIEPVELDGAAGRLAGAKLEIESAHLVLHEPHPRPTPDTAGVLVVP